MKPDLSQDGLHLLLNYDQTIGKFFWRKFRSGGRSNLEAGSFDRDGYIQIMISGRNYKAHRLAWLYVSTIGET